jgi:hypothetical protein
MASVGEAGGSVGVTVTLERLEPVTEIESGTGLAGTT